MVLAGKVSLVVRTTLFTPHCPPSNWGRRSQKSVPLAINCTEPVNLLQWYYLPTMYSLEICLGQLGNLLVILGYIFCLKECLLVQNLKRAYIITCPIVLAHSVVNPAFYFLLGNRFWELLLGRVKLLFC
ncbi:hypothetical protein JZ751_025743 [Albula glossodonta]|uniref:Uncharacterized protein n=1 Tax=Albula glossodonta TaxID=121402 RepID=A0A8T2NLP3_9TELE|nr:hypothetical protein JZ751_025743 [Albula glossodonta]